MKFRIRERVLLLISLPVMLLGLVFIMGTLAAQAAKSSQTAFRFTNSALRNADRLGEAVAEAQAGVQGYALAAKPAFVIQYESAAAEANGRLADLETVAPVRSTQAMDVAQLRASTTSVLGSLRTVERLAASGNPAAARAAIMHGDEERGVVALRRAIDAFRAGQESQLDILRASNALTSDTFMLELGLGTLIGILGTVLAGIGLVRFISERLARVSEHTRSFARGAELSERITGDDEIAELDRTFHAMTVLLEERQASLRSALDRANEVSRLKSEFVATLSHEIRTPMNGVIGMSELLMQTSLSSEQHDYADAVHWSGLALLRIVNDLLDFSKIEAGRMELDRTDFELVETVESVTTLLSAQAQAKGLILMSYIDASVPRVVNGDDVRLRQILLNLVGNALKFTERGSVVVEVVAELAEVSADVRLRFAIRDTGIGIDQTAGTALFEPFAQADGSTTRRFGGTGLGLAISRSLVEMMGGDIGFTSEVGVGTTFTFTIVVPRAGGVEESRLSPSEGLRGARALIVDDDPAACEVLSRYLRSWGMRGDTVSEPHKVKNLLLRAAAQGEPYDVAIIDFRMPEIDGLELGREISADERTASTPLILVTAYDQARRAKSAQDAGYIDYLIKPIRRTQLHDSVVRAINTRIDAITPAPLVPTVISTIASRSERILLVEDNAVNARLAMRQLLKLGFDAVAVTNGRAAVNVLEAGSFDLVLMDCHMPVMDGFEATAQIRKGELRTRRRVPIVAMTANARSGDRDECLAAGMDDYLSKPVALADLQRVVSRWLEAGSQTGSVLVFSHDS